MKTPYIPHLFGEAAEAKLRSRAGWLTAGVASSVPWPKKDVWIQYAGYEYVLRGIENEEPRQYPCISTPCHPNSIDEAMTRLYGLASVFSWFMGGFVDITGSMWSTGAGRYGSRDTFTTTIAGGSYFDCNYLPVVEDDQVRKALAFMREGRRLRHVHEPYSFLSYFKVLESQFTSKQRVAWIEANLDQLDGNAAKRIAELRQGGIDVSKHLYDSGRSAVAHASLGGEIVDPDIPADRRRITADIDVIEALARRYLMNEVGIPDGQEIHRNRDRTTPWHPFIPAETLRRLQAGDFINDAVDLGDFAKCKASIRLWPQEAPEIFKNMELLVTEGGPGVFKLLAINERKTIILRFLLDIQNGRVHALIEESGLTERVNELIEAEVEHVTRYIHSVVSNSKVEICVQGVEPVPCEIVIPVNIIPQPPEQMVKLAVEQFRQRKTTAI